MVSALVRPGHYQLISNQIFKRLERAGESDLHADSTMIELLQRQTEEKCNNRQISVCFSTQALRATGHITQVKLQRNMQNFNIQQVSDQH